jgi:hypothetical protein
MYVYIYLHDQMKHGVANLIRALGVLVGGGAGGGIGVG